MFIRSEYGYPLSFGAVRDDLMITGKDWDAELGLYYFNARWYDPELGRFISPTPLAPWVEEAYVYCDNNPIMFVDCNGLIWEEVRSWGGDVWEFGKQTTLTAGRAGKGYWDSIVNWDGSYVINSSIGGQLTALGVPNCGISRKVVWSAMGLSSAASVGALCAPYIPITVVSWAPANVTATLVPGRYVTVFGCNKLAWQLTGRGSLAALVGQSVYPFTNAVIGSVPLGSLRLLPWYESLKYICGQFRI